MSQSVVHKMEASRLHRLADLIEEFASHHAPNPGQVANSWHESTVRQMEAELCHVYFVTENGKPSGKPIGMLSVYLMPHPWTGKIEIHEQIWFVTEEHRDFGAGLDLLRFLDEEAPRLGAERIIMTHLNNPTGDRLRKVLHRFGYQPLDINYYKEVN